MRACVRACVSVFACHRLTVWVDLLVGVAGVNEAGGTVVLVLQLAVDTRRLAEGPSRGCRRDGTEEEEEEEEDAATRN